MFTILGSLLGFAGSIVPTLFKFLQDARDKAHELDVMQLQADNAEKLREYDAKMFAAQADANFDVAEQQRLSVQNQNDKTGIGWVDAITASVRPLVTYAYFILYATIKLLIAHGMGFEYLSEHPLLLWTDDDGAIFAAIISFWFGERAFRMMGKK